MQGSSIHLCAHLQMLQAIVPVSDSSESIPCCVRLAGPFICGLSKLQCCCHLFSWAVRARALYLEQEDAHVH